MARKRKVDVSSELVFTFPADPATMTDEQVEELMKLLNVEAIRVWVAQAVMASELAEQKGPDQSAQEGSP